MFKGLIPLLLAIQCLCYVCKDWARERDLVTILVSIISFLMYISVVMEYVTVRVFNLSSILSSTGCNFCTNLIVTSLFVYPL